ncbi:MAG TPA: cysteine desulfurase [Alphaproteobacteria bacterium]|nr:cysteine desulfurase [Alphaproteobacteria bacterium]USO06683.1 MAG: cysteine desulfurase [Rhodospirillales bacterium]HOO81131.1 cysteine desulfurase [Alphaproteobacteria bacterium]
MNVSRNYRDDFPVLATQMNGKPLAFLDTAASAQKPQSVINAMNKVLETGYSNIHRGLYRISQDLTADFEAVRAKIARFIGAKSEKEIVFTRNATESINLVAQTWGRTHMKQGDEIILTEMEHHANIVPWQLLQKEIGFTIKVIPVRDDGALDLDAFETLLSEKTRLVSIVQISNAFGIINPINKIITLSKKFNPEIKVLIDGSQGIVHQKIDVKTLGADFYVFTGHKLYGPTGVGVLYGRYDVLETVPPYQGGGDMIERVSFDGTTFKEPPYRFEAGTPAIVEVIGLGAAIDYVQRVGYEHIIMHEAALRDYGHERLSEIDGLKLYGLNTEKTGIFSFTMDCAHPSDIGMILDQCGVAVRAGHHCCMPLMQRFGLDATVRASLGLYSNRQDIDQLLEGLYKVKELFV